MPVDVSRTVNPTQFRHAVGSVLHVARNAPLDVVNKGKMWYPDVHEAIGKAGKEYEFSHSQGAGIVAAASPGMDFEEKNIHALSEVRNLNTSDWAMIHRSDTQPRQPNENYPGKTKAAPRIPEVGAMLREKVPSLSQASDRSLTKTHRILYGGEDPHEVLDKRTGPKTNAFYHNLNDPHGQTEQGRDRVTIDGRAYDIATNTMNPWQQGRGISSAGVQSGQTRYEDFEHVYQAAHSVLQKEQPEVYGGKPASTTQAITWEAGKAVEMSNERFPTQSGKPRKQGPTRAGQKYATRRKSLEPA